MRADRLIRAAILLACCALPRALAGQGRLADSVSVPVDTGRIHVLRLRAVNVSFLIDARAASAVHAEIRIAPPGAPRPSDAGILRTTSAGDSLLIDLGHALAAPRQLAVTMPSGIALQIVGDNGGAVRIEGTDAPVEVSHSNGAVTILDAAGYALVSTSNGGITVRLRSLLPGVPMSFITSNGIIDLTVPSDSRATLLLDDGIAVESEFALAWDRASRPRQARINGGGPTIRLYTNNGLVRIHRLPRD